MLSLKTISEDTEQVISKLAKRNIDARGIIDKVLDIDQVRRTNQTSYDALQAEVNSYSRQIGQLMQQGQLNEAEDMKNKVSAIKSDIKHTEDLMRKAECDLQDILYQIPNLPHDTVSAGKNAADNEQVKSGGTIPTLHAGAVPHWDLAKKYDLIDFELGVKIAGAGFPVYKGMGARLQRSLINYFLDKARHAGYIEVQPPLVVNEASGYGTGQFPDKEGQMYAITEHDLYLIPTAEVPVTNLYRDVILNNEDLPIKNVAYSACFRREAGSYGKDVRGLNRLHQFDKVEIVRIDTPERSYCSLQEMVDYVQSLLDELELPWRILRLCGGDMGFTSALTYDFEVYSVAQERWLEVSSVSNCESFQANRLKCRYRDADNKMQLVHTLNGSALALPRIVAALLENNQTPEGIRIPKVLVPYTGFEYIK